MENSVTALELKRRGVAALEEHLKRGPVKILKRNQCAAVVLSESDYLRLCSAGQRSVPELSAAEWLLQQDLNGTRSRDDIDRDIAVERRWSGEAP